MVTGHDARARTRRIRNPEQGPLQVLATRDVSSTVSRNMTFFVPPSPAIPPPAPLFTVPPLPIVPEHDQVRGDVRIRYNDVLQDGRLALTALLHPMGIVWGRLLADHAVSHLRRSHGVVSILSRLVLEGGDGPISVNAKLSAHGLIQLAQTVAADGSPGRLLINNWLTLEGRRARTHGPPPERAGEPLLAGRVFAEHVFTRLFAPPKERKVVRFDDPALEAIPRAPYTWHAPEALLDVPDGAEAVDDRLYADEGVTAFGISHTDSNQHVNSLVYPRLFEDAVLRRFAVLGLSTKLTPRHLEVAYRKPFFAGDRARILVRIFRDGDRLGAVGSFVPHQDGEDPTRVRPACTLRMSFST